MKPPWAESKGLIPWILLIAAVLLIAVLLKEGLISSKTLVANKDAIDAASKIVTAAGIIIGGFLSYIRFFKGRLLRPKLIISCESGIVPLTNANLHWLDIQIENKGSVAIWNYTIRVQAIYHGNHPTTLEVTRFLPASRADTEAERLIDVGESSYEHAIVEIPKPVLAVSFKVSVVDQSGSLWERCLTTANTVKMDAEAS